MGRCGRLGALRLCSPLAWGILASWMLWALKLQISTRSDRPKNPAILGLMRLNFLSVEQGHTDAAALLGAARSGEPAAALLVDDLCRVMGRTLYNLVVTLDLQRISMGGSVFWHHRDFLLPKVRSHIDGKLAALTHGFDLCAAGLGEKVGDYAALALVR